MPIDHHNGYLRMDEQNPAMRASISAISALAMAIERWAVGRLGFALGFCVLLRFLLRCFCASWWDFSHNHYWRTKQGAERA